MKTLDIELNNLLMTYTNFNKKNDEYYSNNRIIISKPGDKHLTMFIKNNSFHVSRPIKVDKLNFINALKFVCFVKKTGEYLVRPVDCQYTLTLHIYNSNWVIDKKLDNFKERVPFVRVSKNITIYTNDTKETNDRGFCWSRLDSTQQPKEDTSGSMDWGGFSGGYSRNMFNKF